MKKYQSITQRKQERAKKLKRYALLLGLLKAIAIAIILPCLMMCGGCSTTNKEGIKEQCLKSVVTWGDVLECAIKLNEVQG